MNNQAKTKAQLIAGLNALRRLIELLPDGVVVHCEDKLVYANPAAAQMLGANKPEDILGMSSFDFVHPDSRGLLEQRRATFLERLESLPLVEEKLIRLDGKVIDVEVVGIPTTFEGKPAIQGVMREITERKRAEAALRQAEAKYRTLVEQLPAITYILEFRKEGNRVIYISPQVETFLGFTPQEWMANPNILVEQLHPEDRERVLAEAEHLYTGQGASLNLEYRVLSKDERVVWFRNQTKLIRDDAGKPLYSHGVMFDITEQKKLEEKLRQAQKMEAVAQMAGGVAHNFNNVLTALIGHTELALFALASDHPAYKDLETVKKSAQRAAGLTQQLLAFTRHQFSYPTVVNLNDLILNIQPLIYEMLNDADNFIKLELLLAPNLDQVKVDAAQIEQVLVHLAINARDAMPNGGALSIETANVVLDSVYVSQHPDVEPGDYVLVAVSDTGIGMTDEVKNHIFEPFFTTKEVNQGTGLGLSSCFGIVKQSNGHISVYSEPGLGTIFRVYFPRFAKTPVENPISSRQIDRQASRSQTILLVEDEPVVRELAVRVLTQQGYTVLSARDGEDALNLVEVQPDRQIDLLITDLSMPRMSGDVLAKKLTAIHPGLKVLFMSGYTNKAIVRRGIVDAKIEVISKPFTPDTLLYKVNTILSGAVD